MTALVVALTAVVLLLVVLVAGLLRSHADILRALHSLGAGIGDPHDEPDGAARHSGPVPVHMGPSLPKERTSASAVDISGTTVAGDALAVSVTAAPHTLLAFLSSGCATCASFWRALASADGVHLPPGVRLVVVAKGPELEDVALLRTLAVPSIDVVLSTTAWIDYEVPGAPFFALVEGTTSRRVGEGLATTMDQVADLVSRAIHDRGAAARLAVGLDGPDREADNDRLLRDAGIFPGDPSLHPGGVHRQGQPS